jgi:CheY-like chemotaxis protein
MDVLICEDDPVARSVISDLVEDHGGRVLAAIDSVLGATEFLRRFSPDLVIIDLMLHHGTGTELVSRIRRDHPDTRVIVFTAYDALAPHDDPAVEVVVKPDFERLGRMIAGLEGAAGERRRPVRTIPGVPTTVDSHTFYRLIAEAQPDDVLLRIALDGPADGDRVADELRVVLRGHDFVQQRSDSVVALLLGGGDDTVRALDQRIGTQLPHLTDRATSVVAGADPIDAFTRLTTD